MTKRIILCFDGTWNAPDVMNSKGTCYTPTNVQIVFECLEGQGQPLSPTDLEKEFSAPCNDGMIQAGKYIYGVGAATNRLAQCCEGAVGDGLIARVVRGYTYLCRNFQPGDDIVIIGFSRGAYTARAVAGLVTAQGLLDWDAMKLQAGSDQSYAAGLAAWQRYKSTLHCADPDLVSQVGAAVEAFKERFDLGADPAPQLQFRQGEIQIKAVGVWETVGSLGVPDLHDVNGTFVRKDIFQFADLQLSAKVKNGFHAVAIDECRVDFTPTLWDSRDNVVQVLFPGAHSDVGGGYDPSESGLANDALAWMTDKLKSVGVRFSTDPNAGQNHAPDPAAVQHQPWSGTVYLTSPRVIRPGLHLSSSVRARVAAGDVPLEAGTPAPYRPANLLGSYLLPPWTRLAAGVEEE